MEVPLLGVQRESEEKRFGFKKAGFKKMLNCKVI